MTEDWHLDIWKDFAENLDILVSLKEIADLTGMKSSAAVSNWRRRHEDFPLPRLETAAGALFDFHEVQAWLLATKRLNYSVAPSTLLWYLANSLRRWWEPSQIARFIIALLVYFEACERDSEIHVAANDKWDVIGNLGENQVVIRLVEATAKIQDENSQLQSLMFPTLKAAADVPHETLINLVRTLEASVGHFGTSRADLYEETLSWRDQYSRFLAENSTTADMTHLLAVIACTRGPKVLDPAVGEGGVIRAMARDDRMGLFVEREFIGFDLDREALELCRAGCFLWNVDVDLRLADSLIGKDILSVGADVVVCDPPYGVRGWADQGTSSDSRWVYGVPSPNSSDFAWLETVIQSLRQGGVGLVLLPKDSASVGGRDGMIRRAMLEEGVVASAVLLPGRLRRNTPVPLMLWVIRRPVEGETTDGKVLIVDASTMGHSGRELHEFEPFGVMNLAKLIIAFLDGKSLDTDPLLVKLGVPHLVKQVIDHHDIPNGDILQAIVRLKRPEVADVDALRKRRNELQSLVESSMVDTKSATTDLLAILKESR